MKKVLVVFLLVFALGCTKKYTKSSEAPAVPEDTATEEAARTVEEEVVDEMFVDEESILEERLDESPISAEEEASAVFKDILFDFDSYVIRPDARPVLDNIASFLNENINMNIVIEGHCDNRGTNDYNLALGEKRAKATRDYLVSLGVSPLRMIVITYGEEKPLCTVNTESCWQKNRRAHFAIVTE